MQTFQEKYKYNPYSQYSSELEAIISEKKYDEKIANLLRLSFPIMIEYYGHEYKDILFDVLKQVTIEIPQNDENIYDVVKRHTPANTEMKSKTTAVGISELKKSAGINYVFPIFSEENGIISLNGKHEIVSLLDSPNKPEMLATFVHELSHAFKSNKNSMRLIQNENGENILITRTGISTLQSKVYMQDGKIIIEDIDEKNIGLEEGINTYDENNIMNRILSIPINDIPESCREFRKSLILPKGRSTYVSSGYRQETICADKLLNKCKLGQTIKQDQFMGTNNSEQIYNSVAKSPENSWENLNSKMDLLVKHTYERYKHALDLDWFEKNKSEIIGNLQGIHDFLNECATNIESHKSFQSINNTFDQP